MSAKFCHTCIHWENIHKGVKDSQGICHEIIVASKVTIVDDKYAEEGKLFTNGYFGCIYWRENDGSILDFEGLIDEETGEVIDDPDD